MSRATCPVRHHRTSRRIPRATFARAFSVLVCGVLGCGNQHSPPHPMTRGKDAGAGTPDAAVHAVAPDAAIPFEPEPASVYVAKVKNLLVGLPPEDGEVAAVTADPKALGPLIDSWMALPQYASKMRRFFELEFQQTQISSVDLADQVYPRQLDINASTRQALTVNVEESFARTALALVGQGRPFTETMTTRRYMMTPALMELYAYLDVWQIDDDGSVTDRFRDVQPADLTLSLGAAAGPIPLDQTLDPSSANYMHWYDPDVADPAALQKMGPGCEQDPIVLAARADVLHYLLYGGINNHKGPGGVTCQQYGGSAAAPQLVASDFDTWKMVTIRAPARGEERTKFYDLATLRKTDELVLTTPRVGFFTTPAFFANWQTNQSNQMRVTINQALIVATGAAVDGTDGTTPSSTPGLDADHASNGACFSCHQTLDPTRSILTSTYSWNYHDQDDPGFAKQKGLFAFQGVEKKVGSVYDLASVLAEHPLFASAWVQKLCYYANSAACSLIDPEFGRVVGVFQSSGYSWNAVVRELLSSPLTTHASPTDTAKAAGDVVAVSRRDHLCAALDARFGFDNVCGLDTIAAAASKTVIPKIVAGLPSDGYGRGAVAPVLPNQPTLFYRAGLENICGTVAARVVDGPAGSAPAKQWTGKSPDAAITDFVAIVMALTPSNPRSGPATSILRKHFDAARNTGASATNALRSTFVAACLAPSATAIGM